MTTLSIRNLTRRRVPRLPFARVARALLPGWDLSLAFVGAARAKKLNETLRGKTYVPNVLSYVSGAKSGEVVICLSEAETQAPNYALPTAHYLLLLFIHGCLHLKGGVHGATMERRERTVLAKFAGASARVSYVPPHRHRNRHRDLPGQDRRRRRARR